MSNGDSSNTQGEKTGDKHLEMSWQQVIALCYDEPSLFTEWFPPGHPLLDKYSQSEHKYNHRTYLPQHSRSYK